MLFKCFYIITDTTNWYRYLNSIYVFILFLIYMILSNCYFFVHVLVYLLRTILWHYLQYHWAKYELKMVESDYNKFINLDSGVRSTTGWPERCCWPFKELFFLLKTLPYPRDDDGIITAVVAQTGRTAFMASWIPAPYQPWGTNVNQGYDIVFEKWDL